MAKKSSIKNSRSSSSQDCSKEDLQEKIRKKAFELYTKRGYVHGNDFKDWLEAERIVKSQIR